MKLASGVLVLISALVLFVASAYAQQGGTQQGGPGMQQEGQSPEQGRMQQEGAPLTQNSQVVSQVQQALNNQGYNAGPVDGKWGSKTQQALRKFQQAKGMEATGQPDQQTLAALGVSPAGEAAGGGPQGDMGEQQPGMSDQQSGAGGQMSGGQQSGGNNQ